MTQENTLMFHENFQMAWENLHMTQEIAWLHDECSKEAAEVKGQVGGFQMGLQVIRMEWIMSGVKDSTQLWDWHKNIMSLETWLMNLTDNVN